MDAIRPAAQSPIPSAAPQVPSRPDEPVRDRVTLGEQRVTLHVPAGQGRFLQVHKIPTTLLDSIRPASGAPGIIFCEKGDGASAVTRASLDGEALYRFPLQEDARHLFSSADASRLFVVTDARVHSLDPDQGTQIGVFEFPQGKSSPGRQVLAQPDGGLAVIDHKQVVWLDRDLKETRRLDFPFDVHGVKSTPGGGVVATGLGDFYHLGNLQVQAADGRVLFSSEQVNRSNVAVTADGRVQAIEYSESHESHLVSIDERTGETRRWEVPVMARGLFAQPDGTSIAFEPGEYSPHTFVQYASDGTELHRYTFESDQRPRNLLPDPERKQAWVVTGSPSETVLHRLDFNSPGPAVEVLRGAGTLVVAPPLPDGRLVVFGPKEITVLGPDGTPQATFGTLQSLRDALGNAPLQENWVLSEAPYSEKAPLDAWLAVAAKYVPLPDRNAFLDGGPGYGDPTRGADGCLDFTRTVDGETALRAMHLDDPMVYQRMLMRGTDPSLVVGDQARDLAVPGDGARMSVAREKAVIELPGREPSELTYLDLDAALPVKVGDEFYLAMAEKAGGSHRAIGWSHPANGSYARFDVTAPIVGLYGGDADCVYAVGGNGAVLTIEPGQSVEAGVNLPTVELQPEGDEIVVSPDTVSIGGLVLDRRS